jgi:hypothetical protein
VRCLRLDSPRTCCSSWRACAGPARQPG